MFNCFMKGNTFSKTFLETPNHCVESVKQNCKVIKIIYDVDLWPGPNTLKKEINNDVSVSL